MSKPTLPTETEPLRSGAKQIGVRVPADLNRQLQIIARRESNGIAAVCRRLIRRGLREEEQHPHEAA